jgi:hypothetical protein
MREGGVAMQRSRKPSGPGGIRALLLIAVLAAMAGALLGLTSCVDLGCSADAPGTSYLVEPRGAMMAPGESKTFKLIRYDQLGGSREIRSISWSASGGSISPSGVFVAPKKPGDYTVTAGFDGTNYSAKITVVAATAQSTEPSSSSATVVAATTSSEVSPPSSVAQSQGEKERIFECSSDAGGHPGAKIPEFTMDKPRVIVEIMTYHWDYNDHVLGTIALTNVDTGVTYGPWETVGGTGQGGVENAYWLAHPNVEIPAGTYKLVDSSPSTWFTNDEMGGFGGSYVDALK